MEKKVLIRFKELVSLVGGGKAAADLLDVRPETISQWVTGKSKIPLMSAQKLCEKTGRSLDWLVGGQSDFVSHAVMEKLNDYFTEQGIHAVDPVVYTKLIKIISDRVTEKQDSNLESLEDYRDIIDLAINR